jgi:hypothetical protein
MSTNANVAVSLTYVDPVNGPTVKEYAVDTSFEPYRREAFRHRSIPSQRQAIQMTNIVGEGTINTEGLWRREQVEWSMGAGQFSLDRKGDNQETRFLNSKGVDVFSYPFQATLLPDTHSVYPSTGTAGSNLMMVRCGAYVVIVDGTTVKFTSDWSTYTTATFASTPTAINSIASNDTYVFIAANNGVWFFSPALGSSIALYAANDTSTGYTNGYNMVAWANDQLVASCANRLYAFQPRTSSSYPTFGAPPLISDTPVTATNIINNGTYITVVTATPHNLSVNQPFNIVDSNQTFDITTSNGLSVSYASASTAVTASWPSGFVNDFAVGDVVTIRYLTIGSTVISPETIELASSSGTSLTYTSANVNSSNVSDIYGLWITGGANATNAFNSSWIVSSVVSTTEVQATSVSGSSISSFGQGASNGLATPTSIVDVLATHPNPNWVWSGATGGQTQVYFAGYVQFSSTSAGSGCIYRSDMLGSSTTTSSGVQTITSASISVPWNLDYPVQALPMSPDEYPTSIQAYLNYVFIGTNRGIRMTQTLSIYDPTATASGDLKSGPLIPNVLQPVTSPVTAIIGDGRYVWFSWNNYDGTSTGLGRLDLGTYINGDPLTPSYASDIMVTGQGTINSLCWDPITNTPTMAVSSLGIYKPYATNDGGVPVVSKYVASGQITSGVFDYGIPDPKIPVYADLAGIAQGGSSMSLTLTTDPLNPSPVSQTTGSYTGINVQEFTLAANRGQSFEAKVTLNADSDQDVSPILNRWTVKSWPAVVQGTEISAVLQLFSVNVIDGLEVYSDPYTEFIWLETRRQNQDILTYQEGPMTVTCVVDGIDWIPHKRRDVWENGFEGDLVVSLKTIGQYQYTSPVTATELSGL